MTNSTSVAIGKKYSINNFLTQSKLTAACKVSKKISIIIPVFQVEDLVLGCLQSIAAQSYPHFECICVDDSSSDRSAEIVEAFAATDARFKLLRQENKMPGGARNTGMAVATGEYITYADADDYLHPALFETLLQAIETKNAQIAACLYTNTKEQYQPMENEQAHYPEWTDSDPMSTYIYEKKGTQKRKIVTSVWGKLFRRDFIGDTLYHEKIPFQDSIWLIEMLARCTRYVQVDAPYYMYYVGNSSITRSSWSNKKTDAQLIMLRSAHESISTHRPELLPIVRRKLLAKFMKRHLKALRSSSPETREELISYARPKMREIMEKGYLSYSDFSLRWRIALALFLRKKD